MSLEQINIFVVLAVFILHYTQGHCPGGIDSLQSYSSRAAAEWPRP